MGLFDKFKEKAEDQAYEDYVAAARYSFKNPNANVKKVALYDAQKKVGRRKEVLIGYIEGSMYWQDTFCERWVYYLKQGQNSAERVQSLCQETGLDSSEIAPLTIELDNFLEGKYEELSLLPICLNCGTIIGKWFEICPGCEINLVEGKPVYEQDENEDTSFESEQQIRDYKFCSACGTKLASDAAFCNNCGTKQ